MRRQDMKTKKITTWISLVAIAGLLAGTAAILAVPVSGEAFQRGMRGPRWQEPGPPGMMPFGRFLRELDLTEQQKDAIRDSMMSERESNRDLFQRLAEARKNLQDAVLRGEDETVIAEFAQAVGSVETEAALAQAQHFSSIIAILEPEQLAKLKDLVSEAESRRQERQERFQERQQQ
jgi:Spy/CpxP family protein refolding chaperone